MGSGMDRAGYLQIAGAVEADLFRSTGATALCTCPVPQGWCRLEVLSSEVIFANITAPSITNDTKFDSGTTFKQNWALETGKITSFRFSTLASGRFVLAHRRVLI